MGTGEGTAILAGQGRGCKRGWERKTWWWKGIWKVFLFVSWREVSSWSLSWCRNDYISISFTVNLCSHFWENAAECKLRVSPRFQTLAYLFMKILIFLWKLFQPEVITLVGSLNREMFLSRLILAFYYNSISYGLYTNCVLSGLKFDETGWTTSLLDSSNDGQHASSFPVFAIWGDQ